MKSAFKFLFLAIILLNVLVFARVDNRTYLKSLDTPAVWINPKKISVYVEKSDKSYIFERAFEIWDDSMRSNMNFITIKDKKNADIMIDCIEKLDGNKVGVTYPGHINIQGKTYLYKTKILIARKDPMGFTQNDKELLKVTLHEIGHAIGILGHSDSLNDIMYPSTASTQSSALSLRDIDTVKKLYGF